MYRCQPALSVCTAVPFRKAARPISMAQVRNRTCSSFAASQTQTGADADPDLKDEEKKPSVQDEIERALKSAQSAADSAESALDEVSNLPSSKETPQVLVFLGALLRRMLTMGFVALACAHLLLTQDSSFAMKSVTAAAITVAIGFGGYAKKSLDLTGALMALFVGSSTIISNYAIGGVLVSFFISSSLLTRVSASMKRRIDAEFKEGGQRDWKQVACNGLIPALVALAYGMHTNFIQGPFLGGVAVGATTLATALQGAAMGYYSCCCGDTWASEVGVLSPSLPRMIISGRPVRRGTNGAVSALGLVFSAAGGLLMGLVGSLFAVVGTPGGQDVPGAWKIILVGVFGGLFGSLVDSLLGATLQFSGYNQLRDKVVNYPGEGVHKISGTHILTNNQVNVVSASITAAVTALMCVVLFA